jgi:hypothetical protein
VDIFSGISKAFLPNLPGFMMSDKMRDEALDVEFFWVNESGQHAELTGGMSVKPTVRIDITTSSALAASR